MKRDVSEERDAAIKEKRLEGGSFRLCATFKTRKESQMSDNYEMKKEFLRKWLIVVTRSGKFSTIFSVVLFFLVLGSLITLFMGDTYDFLNQCLVTLCTWMAAARLFVYKLEHPDSRVARWAFRLVLLLSIVHTILLVRYL